MSSVSNAIGSYFAIKNMNASILAKASLQKFSQDQMEQQMSDLLKDFKPAHLGNKIDVRI